METKINNFNGFDVRCVTQDDVVWFVAKDIVEAIGAAWNSVHSTKHIPEKWKGVYPIHPLTGSANKNPNPQDMVCLTEEGVNFYLFRSDKSAALPFQEWLAGEVLPSLKKHGGYNVGQELMSKEEYLSNALIVAKSVLDEKDGIISSQSEKINILEFANASYEQKLAMLKPKEDFYDSVNRATNKIDFKTFANKLISQATGKPLGRNTLLAQLRNLGILTTKNQPYQQFSHYFDVATYVANNQVVSTTFVKPNGITYLTKRLQDAKIVN